MDADGAGGTSRVVVDDIVPFGTDARFVAPRFSRRLGPRAGAPVDGFALWPADAASTEDSHAGFNVAFLLSAAAEVEVQLLAVDVYRAWLDGDRLCEGPARFPVAAPSAEVVRRRLGAGDHRLAVHVHGWGVKNRILPPVEPFLWCRVLIDGIEPVELDWRAGVLQGYQATKVRTSPLLGWVEWADTRSDPGWWEGEPPVGWRPPARRRPGLGPIARLRAPVPTETIEMKRIADGRYRERRAVFYFPGEEIDDPVVRMATTDLAPSPAEEADGIWCRYDLGRVRSGTVKLTVDALPGTELLIGTAERLSDGRLIPALAPGRTCFVSRFVLRGGRQDVETLAPNGARYVEIRLGAERDARVLEEEFVERDGLGPPVGSFTCGDQRLDQMWRTGIETMRAAADDALIDSIRERAQWTGDTLTVGLELGGAAWNDLSLFRQALLHAAECANREGLVAGCGPGDVIYLSSYAAYWTSAAVRYVELTGDLELLAELLPAARANLAALRARMRPDGVFDETPWPFVDWGHSSADGCPDPALLGVVLSAARDQARWAELIGEADAESEAYQRQLTGILAAALPAGDPAEDWWAFGYHATVWALRCGLVPTPRRRAAVESVKQHMLRCFPNDPDAPRLRDPGFRDSRVITPFFGHFALDVLLDSGETDFVLDQWRACWGWMLDQGATTWWEVFDEGWSQCHFWSGCPTWQMSRYLLGLWPRLDRGPGEADLRLRPGSLPGASGVVPLSVGEAAISWQRSGDRLTWRITPTAPLTLQHVDGRHRIEASASLELELDAGDLIAAP